MSTARVLIGDRTGKIVAEVSPALGPVSWRLNNVGRATFVMAKTDPKATADVLCYGNRVLIEFDNGLPSWGGVIDPPRKWSESGIEVTAYSGEYLLGLRQTDYGRYFSGATVGHIFERLIVEANEVWPTGVTVGSAWGGGDPHSPEYHFGNLLDKIRDSVCRRLSTADFEIVPSLASGVITFTAYLYERRGSDKPGVVLLEGHNLAGISLLEQGKIVNSWDLAGSGTTWGDDRLMAHEEDAASISAYGFREGSAVYPDTVLQATLDTTAENLLAESKDPHNILQLSAVDKSPAAFASYDVGDCVRVMLHSYGFGGYDHMVKVQTREYDVAAGTCTLVVREE